MGFGAIKTPVEAIKEGEFGCTYSRDICSSVNGKWFKKLWKKTDQLKNIDQKYYCSNYYDASANKYGVECETFLRLQKNKGWINEIYLYGWFHWSNTKTCPKQKKTRLNITNKKVSRTGSV